MLTVHPFIPYLSTLYQEPHRAYHSLQHIHTLTRIILTGQYVDMIDIDRCNEIATTSNKISADGLEQHKNFLQLVAWFHDCYYDPYLGSPYNEQESARIFHALTPSINFPTPTDYTDQVLNVGNYKHYDQRLKQRVTDAILATSLHSTNIKTEHLPIETLIFLDLDMLGFYDKNEMDRNDIQIRKEYYKSSDRIYLMGRIAFLKTLLAKPNIYYTLKPLYEQSARINIQDAITECKRALDCLPS